MTTDTTEILRIIRKYCEQFNLDNPEEMYKFLETYNRPTLNQKESENLNRPITTNKIESIIKKLPPNKSPRPDGFTGEFYQRVKEELTPILKVFQNV